MLGESFMSEPQHVPAEQQPTSRLQSVLSSKTLRTIADALRSGVASITSGYALTGAASITSSYRIGKHLRERVEIHEFSSNTAGQHK